MSSFKDYQSKPVTRRAYEIKGDDVLWTSESPSTWRIQVDGELISFKAYEDPQPGDYIVYLTESDIYHCSRPVFHERNVVES